MIFIFLYIILIVLLLIFAHFGINLTIPGLIVIAYTIFIFIGIGGDHLDNWEDRLLIFIFDRFKSKEVKNEDEYKESENILKKIDIKHIERFLRNKKLKKLE